MTEKNYFLCRFLEKKNKCGRNSHLRLSKHGSHLMTSSESYLPEPFLRRNKVKIKGKKQQRKPEHTPNDVFPHCTHPIPSPSQVLRNGSKDKPEITSSSLFCKTIHSTRHKRATEEKKRKAKKKINKHNPCKKLHYYSIARAIHRTPSTNSNSNLYQHVYSTLLSVVTKAFVETLFAVLLCITFI